MALRLQVNAVDDLEAYATLSSAFETGKVCDVVEDSATVLLVQRELPRPFAKDYDRLEDPRQWARTFDTSRWALLSAWQGEARVGGAIIARDTTGVDMLEGHSDLAVLWDLRVEPTARRRGVGAALVQLAQAWALQHACNELKVETQNTNPAACAFYACQGFALARAIRGAYAELPDEVQLIWRKPLAKG